jgi:hypothetical protein
VTGRVNHQGAGAYVVWTIANNSRNPLSPINLHVRSRDRSIQTIAIVANGTVKPRSRITFASELDWSFLTADSIVVADAHGRHHRLRRRDLARLRRQLREMTHRPLNAGSAREWVHGTANLALGIALLGLGVFMLLWVIATG